MTNTPLHATLPGAFAAVLIFAAACPAFAGEAAAAAPASTANAPTYRVNFSAPWKVGQKFAYSAEGRQSMSQSVTIAGQPQGQTAEKFIQLEADCEVLAVFPNNSPQKITYTVKSCRGSLGPGQPPSDLLPAGTIIVATAGDNGNESVTVNGSPAGEAIGEMLEMVVDLGDERTTDQAIFGPPGPVAVGASWPVNGAALLAADPTISQELGATGATGSFKLLKITGTGDDQVADVSGSVALTGVNMPIPVPPKVAEFKVDMTGSIPATTTKGVLKQSMNMTANIVADVPGPDGSTMTMTMKMSATASGSYTFR